MKKKLITTAVAASALVATLALTSTSVFAQMTNPGNNNQSVRNVITATAAKNVQNGNIQYTKKTLFNPDDSIAAVNESWSDPTTHDKKAAYSEPVKGTLSLLAGGYVLNNGTTYIKYGKDDQGNLVGTEFNNQNHNWSNALKADKQDYINETKRAGWKDEGTVQTADGEVLNKLYRADKSNMPGEEGTVYTECVYVDKSSGLPVKGEIDIEKHGSSQVLYTYVYEYKNVSNPGSLFDTKGITIKNVVQK